MHTMQWSWLFFPQMYWYPGAVRASGSDEVPLSYTHALLCCVRTWEQPSGSCIMQSCGWIPAFLCYWEHLPTWTSSQRLLWSAYQHSSGISKTGTLGNQQGIHCSHDRRDPQHQALSWCNKSPLLTWCWSHYLLTAKAAFLIHQFCWHRPWFVHH